MVDKERRGKKREGRTGGTRRDMKSIHNLNLFSKSCQRMAQQSVVAVVVFFALFFSARFAAFFAFRAAVGGGLVIFLSVDSFSSGARSAFAKTWFLSFVALSSPSHDRVPSDSDETGLRSLLRDLSR